MLVEVSKYLGTHAYNEQQPWVADLGTWADDEANSCKPDLHALAELAEVPRWLRAYADDEQ